MASQRKEVIADEKRKRSAPQTRVKMDFDPKPSIGFGSSQEEVNEYLVRHRGLLSMIAEEFCSAKTNVKVEPPAGSAYFHL